MSKTLTITAQDGQLFSAYLALPKSDKANGKVIIIFQEIFGVNHFIKQTCDDYAKLGYTACAPDLFWRIRPYLDLGYDQKDREIAMQCYQQFDPNLALHDIGALIKTLKKNDSQKIIVLGFCLGGKMAYLTAAQYPINAAICYYGVGLPEQLEKAPHIHCPIQFHFGGDDANITSKHIKAIQQAFKNKKDAEIYIYPDAEHAFANPDRPSYHKNSADLAYSRVLKLLK